MDVPPGYSGAFEVEIDDALGLEEASIAACKPVADGPPAVPWVRIVSCIGCLRPCWRSARAMDEMPALCYDCLDIAAPGWRGASAT